MRRTSYDQMLLHKTGHVKHFSVKSYEIVEKRAMWIKLHSP